MRIFCKFRNNFPEVLHKTSSSKNFGAFLKKKTHAGVLIQQNCGVKAWTLLNRTPQQVLSCELAEILKTVIL